MLYLLEVKRFQGKQQGAIDLELLYNCFKKIYIYDGFSRFVWGVNGFKSTMSSRIRSPKTTLCLLTYQGYLVCIALGLSGG